MSAGTISDHSVMSPICSWTQASHSSQSNIRSTQVTGPFQVQTALAFMPNPRMPHSYSGLTVKSRRCCPASSLQQTHTFQAAVAIQVALPAFPQRHSSAALLTTPLQSFPGFASPRDLLRLDQSVVHGATIRLNIQQGGQCA